MPNRTYLTNGNVAWEIPDGGKLSIAWYYQQGLYVPPENWKVERKIPKNYRRGTCGELRREEK